MIRETINYINSSITKEKNNKFLGKIQNPKIPKLYGLPKIHKLGNRMRHIVSNNNLTTYKITMYLVSTFMNFEKFDSQPIKQCKTR